MRRLPYLNGIRAFEASARCGSFAAAARELNVTPAAVSRMVRLLEDRLGVGLFERTANRLALTPAGQDFHVGLTPILDALAMLAEKVAAQSKTRVLTVGVGPTFAVRWLIPRLISFQKIAPDVEVRMTAGGIAAPFSDDWTCGIKLGDGHWPDLVSERLFEATLTPVCAPAFARQVPTVRDLQPIHLLRVAHAPDDWPNWLKAAQCASLVAKGPSFEFYTQAQQAAADGVGVAMGIRPYIDEDIAAGRLVAPFQVSVPKGLQWYLIYRPHRRSQPVFEQFRAWLFGSL